MTIQTLEMASVFALSDLAASRLARSALTNDELRDALQTTPSMNGVKIGGWEITFDADQRYDIASLSNPEQTIKGIVYYETARRLVRMLNRGARITDHAIAHVADINSEYARASMSAAIHAERTRHYDAIGDDFRAELNENRFSRDAARAKTLRQRLLARDPGNY